MNLRYILVGFELIRIKINKFFPVTDVYVAVSQYFHVIIELVKYQTIIFRIIGKPATCCIKQGNACIMGHPYTAFVIGFIADQEIICQPVARIKQFKFFFVQIKF